MEGIDLAILGVGVVVLIASVVGVIVYEPAAGDEFRISFQASDPQAVEPAPDDQTGAAQTFTFEVPIDRANIVDALFDVTVTTGAARLTDDQVSVTVTGPGELSTDGDFSVASGNGGAATETFSVHVHDVPSATVVSAADETAAREAALSGENGWTTGNGTWTIEVTITAGTSAPTGPASPTYTVTVEPSVQVLEIATVGPDLPDVRG